MLRNSLFLSIFFLSCIQLKDTPSNNALRNERSDDFLYKVYKIDSINSYYLVYSVKRDTLYKIVSKKEFNLVGNQVMVGKNYPFQLSSIWTKPIIIGEVNASPSVTPHVTCLSFDDSTKICLEKDSINDIHQASNLRGLYFIR
jgi:hypothetical protein